MIPQPLSMPSPDIPVGWGRYQPPGTGWLGRRVTAVAAAWRRDADDASAGERTRGVCPFCGRSYEERRQRCGACGSLPVVAPDDRQVYDAVLANCGPDCDRVAVRRRTGSAGYRQ